MYSERTVKGLDMLHFLSLASVCASNFAILYNRLPKPMMSD